MVKLNNFKAWVFFIITIFMGTILVVALEELININLTNNMIIRFVVATICYILIPDYNKKNGVSYE